MHGEAEFVDQGRGRPPRYEGADPYALRGSFVSLLVWEGRTMLEVAAQAGHGVDVCEMYYARIFEGLRPGAPHQRGGGDPGRPPNRRTPDGRHQRSAREGVSNGDKA